MKATLYFLVTVLLSLPQVVRADYVMRLQHNGDSLVVAEPGTRFSVTVALNTDAADQHNSAIFRIVFSDPGLVLEGYQWQAPYANDSFDFSTPRFDTLPEVIDADSFNNGDNAVDLYLSNASTIPFADGALLRLDFLVPATYTASDQITMQMVPDTLALGFPPPVPTVAGPAFTVSISCRILDFTVAADLSESTLTWASATGLHYDILRADEPGGLESNVRTNIEGEAGSTSETVPLNGDKGVFWIRQQVQP